MQTHQVPAKASDGFTPRTVASASRASAQANRNGLYPAHAIGGWRDVDGTSVDTRPIATSDGEALREFVRSLSFESRYLRFMSAVNELDSRTVERLTKIDHQRDAALIARVRDSKTDRVVGVARYALEADGRSCDFAIAVADDWRRRSLGRRLMTLLVDTARQRGLKGINGDVLAINGTMLAFVRALGFGVVMGEDPTLRRVHLDLGGGPSARPS